MQEFTAKEYLKIDIANSFGLDKETWDYRINWFNQNESDLFNLIHKADEPAMFFAGIQAWTDVQEGKSIGYPISLDATASGMQILAVLTGDRPAAEICNVVSVDTQRKDAYTEVYNRMLLKLNDVSKIERDDTKRAIMTSLYGSEAIPREVFGDGEVFNIFEATMQEMAPASWDLNKAFLDIWNPEAYEYNWTLPDNFHVKIKVMDSVSETVHFNNQPFQIIKKVNMPIDAGRSLSANTVHSIDGMIVRELTRRCSYDPKVINRLRKHLAGDNYGDVWTCTQENSEMVKILWDHYLETGYLSARILDHLDAINIVNVDSWVILDLLKSLPEKPFNILSIHDCFRVHPNYGNDLRKQYNLQLYLLAKSNLLSSLISQIMNKVVKIGKYDENMADSILDSNYSLS